MPDIPCYDPQSECQKCGSWSVDGKYLSGLAVDLFLGLKGVLTFPISPQRPHQAMGRTCTRCGFKWLERLNGNPGENFDE